MACWDEAADNTDSAWPVAKKVGGTTTNNNTMTTNTITNL